MPSLNHHQLVNSDGSVAADRFSVQEITTTSSKIIQEHSYPQRVLCWLTTAGSEIIRQAALKFLQLMDIIVLNRRLVFYNTKVSPLILIRESCGLFT